MGNLSSTSTCQIRCGQSGEVFAALPLSPSLSACLRIDSRSVSTFIRRCESLHCPAAPLLKCADELTPSRQIRTCYLKSGLRSLINRSASLSALSRCLICRSILAGRTLPLKPWMQSSHTSALHAYPPVWLPGVDSSPIIHYRSIHFYAFSAHCMASRNSLILNVSSHKRTECSFLYILR